MFSLGFIAVGILFLCIHFYQSSEFGGATFYVGCIFLGIGAILGGIDLFSYSTKKSDKGDAKAPSSDATAPAAPGTPAST
jgi:hypothetical protein